MKDNNVNYNTDQSNAKAFVDTNTNKEKKSLEVDKRSFIKNPDTYNLPNKRKLRFNKSTKTWQDVSKKEINDKIIALEKIKIKTFEQVINEYEYAFGNEQFNSETFITELEKDIFKYKGQLGNLMASVNTGNPHLSNIFQELNIHFNDIISLIKSRHDNFLK